MPSNRSVSAQPSTFSDLLEWRKNRSIRRPPSVTSETLETPESPPVTIEPQRTAEPAIGQSPKILVYTIPIKIGNDLVYLYLFKGDDLLSAVIGFAVQHNIPENEVPRLFDKVKKTVDLLRSRHPCFGCFRCLEWTHWLSNLGVSL
jgi:hypothetical protein